MKKKKLMIIFTIKAKYINENIDIFLTYRSGSAYLIKILHTLQIINNLSVNISKTNCC